MNYEIIVENVEKIVEIFLYLGLFIR